MLQPAAESRMPESAGITPATACLRPLLGRRGFTLVEIIVVIIIIAILAAVTLPRIYGNVARRADAEAQHVQRLFTIAAEREALANESVALEYDDRSASIRLLVLRTGAAASATRGTTSAQSEAMWSEDRMVMPAVFTDTTLVGAWTDGRPLPRGSWRLVFSQSQPRPVIALQVDAKSATGPSALAWQITLGPEDSAAIRTPSRPGQSGVALSSSRSIDLDAGGKGDKPW